MILACTWMFLIISENGVKIASSAQDLSTQEKNAIRKMVASDEWKIGVTLDDDGGFNEVLHVPAGLQKTYKQKQKATISFLLRIVEVGRASDSRLAAAYALALVESPVVAAVVVRIPLNDYDADCDQKSVRIRMLETIKNK